jgi:hypothetical protein
VRGRTMAIVAMMLLATPSGAIFAQSPDVTVEQIPAGVPSLLGEKQPELSAGTDVAVEASPVRKPINCTGASKATKPECFTATLQRRK